MCVEAYVDQAFAGKNEGGVGLLLSWAVRFAGLNLCKMHTGGDKKTKSWP